MAAGRANSNDYRTGGGLERLHLCEPALHQVASLEELPAEKDVIVSVTHVVLQKDRASAPLLEI